MSTCRSTRLVLLLVSGLAILGGFTAADAVDGADALPVPAAGELQRVTFADGRTLEVLSVAIREGRATLRTQGGHVIGFAADRIVRIESIPAPPAPDPGPAVAGPEDTGAGPAATPPSGPGGMPAVDGTPAPPVVDDGNLEAIIREAAAHYDLEVDLLAAVIAVESGYRSDAISSKGAQGLMQLMPATAKDLAVVNPFNPRENVFAGAKYLKELLDKNGDQYWRALAAYNAGPGRVARYDGLPPYKETMAYIRKVFALYSSPKPIPENASIAR